MKYEIKPIDKKTLKETLVHYRAWNEEKLLTHAYLSRRRTSAEKWQAFQELYSFAFRINPNLPPWLPQRRLEEWSDYYARVRRFEELRQRHGQKA